MVQFEEVVVEKVAAPTLLVPEEKEKKKKKSGVKAGFLNDPKRESLYGPEGSVQGHVSKEQQKKWQEKDVNDKMNQDMGAAPKKGQDDEDEKPPWYTNQWPRHCQYNNPGCDLDPLDESKSKSDFHMKNLRDNARWQKLVDGTDKEIRLSYNSIPDDMIQEICDILKKNENVEFLDLSHNEICDAGIQTLVGELAGGMCPKLKELMVYNNKFGELGRMMLEKGLTAMRKGLQIHVDTPEWLRNAQQKIEEKKKAEEEEKEKEQELAEPDLD